MRRFRLASRAAAALAAAALAAQAATGGSDDRSGAQEAAAPGLAQPEADRRTSGPSGEAGASAARLAGRSPNPLTPSAAPGAAALAPDPPEPFFAAAGTGVLRTSPVRPGPRVALIFDDGPSPQTLDVVRELQGAGARATFFLVGRAVDQRPELVQVLRDSGMELGNHTWSRAPMARLDARVQRNEIDLTAAAITEVAGVRPRLFRPPDIAWDANTARAASAAGELGVLHTVETNDWRRPGRQAIVRAGKQASAGDIIALQDAGGDRSQTVAAIRPTVRALRRRGLECVTVSELLRGPALPTPRPLFTGLERQGSAPPS